MLGVRNSKRDIGLKKFLNEPINVFQVVNFFEFFLFINYSFLINFEFYTLVIDPLYQDIEILLIIFYIIYITSRKFNEIIF